MSIAQLISNANQHTGSAVAHLKFVATSINTGNIKGALEYFKIGIDELKRAIRTTKLIKEAHEKIRNPWKTDIGREIGSLITKIEDDFRNGKKEILSSFVKFKLGKMEECLSFLSIAFERDLNDVQKRLEKLIELNLDIMDIIGAGFGT